MKVSIKMRPKVLFIPKKQMTVFTVVTYHRDSESGSLIPTSHAIISDDLKHDAAANHLFLEKIFEKGKSLVPGLKKIFVWSDGGPGHFKNKFNFSNLSKFKSDYGIDIEWHFWASCHGKNAGNGVGGTVKREAKRASLEGHEILKAQQLYEWGREKLKGINFIFVSEAEVARRRDELVERFSLAATIKGTHLFHAFVPVSDGVLRVSKISRADRKTPSVTVNMFRSISAPAAPVRIPVAHSTLQIDDFVACVLNEQWWIGRVLDLSDENGINVHLTKEPGPRYGYTWDLSERFILIEDVLVKIAKPKSRTRSARSFGITKDETEKITNEFELYNL